MSPSRAARTRRVFSVSEEREITHWAQGFAWPLLLSLSLCFFNTEKGPDLRLLRVWNSLWWNWSFFLFYLIIKKQNPCIHLSPWRHRNVVEVLLRLCQVNKLLPHFLRVCMCVCHCVFTLLTPYTHTCSNIQALKRKKS